jgi:FdhD protein
MEEPANSVAAFGKAQAAGTSRVEHVIHWNHGNTTERSEMVAVEEPLEIRCRGRAVTITMRTPGHDEELAAGFLLTEGVIESRHDILRMEPCNQINEDGTENNVLNVLLAPEVAVDFARLTRHVFAASSCGICGKASIDSIRNRFPGIESTAEIEVSTLITLPDKMRSAQVAFDSTGGIHAAGLFDGQGRLITLREDVGRHNAVDKVVGQTLLSGQQTDVLMVSGRTSFEILQKALAARIPIIAAVSAPSSLAVEFAREMGQTLIGFLRDRRMNIYTHAHRVLR